MFVNETAAAAAFSVLGDVVLRDDNVANDFRATTSESGTPGRSSSRNRPRRSRRDIVAGNATL